MIRELEEKYPFLQMSFENNSLEDVFINIGMQQNPHLQNIWRDLAEEELEIAPIEANFDNKKISKLFMKQIWAIFLHSDKFYKESFLCLLLCMQQNEG